MGGRREEEKEKEEEEVCSVTHPHHGFQPNLTHDRPHGDLLQGLLVRTYDTSHDKEGRKREECKRSRELKRTNTNYGRLP